MLKLIAANAKKSMCIMYMSFFGFFFPEFLSSKFEECILHK